MRLDELETCNFHRFPQIESLQRPWIAVSWASTVRLVGHKSRPQIPLCRTRDFATGPARVAIDQLVHRFTEAECCLIGVARLFAIGMRPVRRLSGVRLVGANLEGANLANADLRYARLGQANLTCANLSGADLRNARFAQANLKGADLSRAALGFSNLRRANFSNAKLRGAVFWNADVERAVFRNASIQGGSFVRANLSYVDFTSANLAKADFSDANLTHANLENARFDFAQLSHTVLGGIDLSSTRGLGFVNHMGPSMLDNRTFSSSNGNVPDSFLKGCGYQEWEIAAARLYDRDLTEAARIEIHYRVIKLQSMAPIQRNPVFISYTHADGRFVDRLEKALDEKGVRAWRDVHHAEAGPLEKVVGRAISLNPTMVLVLSQASANSDWVAWEIDKAIELEKELNRPVLCPIALDDSWSEWLSPPHHSRLKRYSILDYSGEDAIEKMMPRLLKGLDIHYRSEGHGNV